MLSKQLIVAFVAFFIATQAAYQSYMVDFSESFSITRYTDADFTIGLSVGAEVQLSFVFDDKVGSSSKLFMCHTDVVESVDWSYTTLPNLCDVYELPSSISVWSESISILETAMYTFIYFGGETQSFVLNAKVQNGGSNWGTNFWGVEDRLFVGVLIFVVCSALGFLLHFFMPEGAVSIFENDFLICAVGLFLSYLLQYLMMFSMSMDNMFSVTLLNFVKSIPLTMVSHLLCSYITHYDRVSDLSSFYYDDDFNFILKFGVPPTVFICQWLNLGSRQMMFSLPVCSVIFFLFLNLLWFTEDMSSYPAVVQEGFNEDSGSVVFNKIVHSIFSIAFIIYYLFIRLLTNWEKEPLQTFWFDILCNCFVLLAFASLCSTPRFFESSGDRNNYYSSKSSPSHAEDPTQETTISAAKNMDILVSQPANHSNILISESEIETNQTPPFLPPTIDNTTKKEKNISLTPQASLNLNGLITKDTVHWNALYELGTNQ
eukprot:TRINITY_DN1624_c0_g1_i1.p1 TRINITY_DN1624_c0_g1~~TRINITY_DN1624_c0_g1_i1.p1  ORF type:complete len:496 (+),score=93.56 TRINITY_DN1624_c0_g1_i1:29-1489(+)